MQKVVKPHPSLLLVQGEGEMQSNPLSVADSLEGIAAVSARWRISRNDRFYLVSFGVFRVSLGELFVLKPS